MGAVEVRELVRSLPQRGATTLLCTHRLAEIEATCDYVVVLQNGSLIAQGPLADVIAAASGGGLAIRVRPDEVDAAMAIVANLGLGEPSVRGDEIVTTGIPDDPAIVTRALADQGIFLQELAVRRATLEQACLQLTHGAEADAA